MLNVQNKIRLLFY